MGLKRSRRLGLSLRSRREQAVAPAMIASFTFVPAERCEVLFVLDLLAHAPGAGMASDLDFAIEHAYDILDERLGDALFRVTGDEALVGDPIHANPRTAA